MTELQAEYRAPFVAHKMKYAAEQIEIQRETFWDAFQEASIVDALRGLGVSFKLKREGEDCLRIETPLGEIKAEFVPRLEGAYLGVAVVFSFLNDARRDEKFFFVRMNHQTPWVDSAGTQFKTNFMTERPELSEFAMLMQRVLAARLQILDASLLAV